MPRLSDPSEEATVIQWLKQPGEPVARGEPLVEIETDKATMVYEAEFEGVLDEIVVDEGTTAALGQTIARARRDGRERRARRRPRRPPRRPRRASPPIAPRRRPAVHERRQGRQAPRHPRRAAARGRAGRLARGRERDRARRPDRAGRRPRRVAPAPRPRDGRDRAHADAADDRPADDRVACADPRVHARGGDRHGGGRRGLREELRALGREPLPSFNDLVVKAVGARAAQASRR